MICSRIKKSITIAMLLLLISSSFAAFTGTTRAQEVLIPDIGSQAAVLMEFSRGEIIYSKNGSEILHPASLTKIMTLALAYEALQKGGCLEETVPISQKAWETGAHRCF